MSKNHDELAPKTLESAGRQLEIAHEALDLHDFSKPQGLSNEQRDTPDLVHYQLGNGDYVRIGPANDKNTPSALWDKYNKRADFVVWYTTRSRETTTYFVGLHDKKGTHAQDPFVATPRDSKNERFRWLDPSAEDGQSRWKRFAKVVGELAALDIVRLYAPIEAEADLDARKSA